MKSTALKQSPWAIPTSVLNCSPNSWTGVCHQSTRWKGHYIQHVQYLLTATRHIWAKPLTPSVETNYLPTYKRYSNQMRCYYYSLLYKKNLRLRMRLERLSLAERPSLTLVFSFYTYCTWSHQPALEMCNLSWTPHSNLEKDNSLNHSCVSPSMGCLEYT